MTPQRKLQHKLQDYENYAKIKYTPEINNAEIFFVKRSQFIRIKNPLNKQSEKACMNF